MLNYKSPAYLMLRSYAITPSLQMFSDSKKLFGLEPNLLELKGEYWRSSRHAISPTFTGNKMKQVPAHSMTHAFKMEK